MMFERFTTDARAVVIGAREEAGRLRHRAVGTEHLLLAMLADPRGAGGLLGAVGVTRARVEAELTRLVGGKGAPRGPNAEDAAALRAIGIDIDEVRARLEENFGPVSLDPPPEAPRRGFFTRRREDAPVSGHIPFSPRAKKALELSLREAVRLKHRHIAAEHILLGVLREGEGLAAQILVTLGVDFRDLRRRTEAALRAAA
jgi:ATP-dependent Clp protease ATP-binding subunit ClpA